MKTGIILSEFRTVSPGTAQAAPAGAQAAPERPAPAPVRKEELGEDFREMQHRRYTMPYVSAVPYRHWGINE
jgi:hypothetical protein